MAERILEIRRQAGSPRSEQRDAADEALPFLDDTLPPRPELADARILWGPDFCRLEYLRHLVETGRVKDDGVMKR